MQCTVVRASAKCDRATMRQQAFGFCQRLGGAGQAKKALARNGLRRNAFHEVRGGQAAARARPRSSGKNVIATGDVVAERLSGPGAKKDSAAGGDFP